MKPVIFAVLATLCYAAANLIMDQRFAKYNNLTVMVCYSLVIFLSASLLRQITKTNDPSFNFPQGSSLVWVVIMGLIFTAADYFYIGAYTNGGSLMTVTSIIVMFPVFAGVLKYLWTGDSPNGWQVGSCLVAIVAVLMAAKGSVEHVAK